MAKTNLFHHSHLPRWLVLLLDLSICTVSLFLAYLIRFNFQLETPGFAGPEMVLPILLAVRTISFLVFRSYAGMIRYTSARDTERILIAVLAGSAVLSTINAIEYFFIDGSFFIPFSVLLTEFFVTTFLMIYSRLAIKNIYQELTNPSKLRKNVIIFGGDQYGSITKRTIDRELGMKQKVVAFIDDNKHFIGKKIEGITIHELADLERLIDRYSVQNLIISRNDVDPGTRQKIIQKCLQKDIQILTVPSFNKWIQGKLSYDQIRTLNIEEILERQEIKLDTKQIQKDLVNKVILITGAAGSIGSEIARQVSLFYPEKLVLIDQAESALYDLELELRENYPFMDIEVMLADVANFERMEYIFQQTEPNMIYHAAAYKHVPLIEENVSEAVLTNVQGTKNVADLSFEYRVDKFVFISTDKAVNPTNVMGASKRIAEIYTQSLNQMNKGKFVTIRFGNVLGSSGSVMPRFKKQIEKGGPITITHPEITRYFMTITEACQLVLEAGSMGQGGEIFIFDMGESVKIIDLARNMARLYGLKPGEDIEVKYTGLRPGEKLHEELLTQKENIAYTYHPKIMVARVEKKNHQQVREQVDKLLQVNKNLNHFKTVEQMKYILPEYKSKNSIYKDLDFNNMKVIK